MPGRVSPDNKTSKRAVSLRRISSIRHLTNSSFDVDSPYTKQAIKNLGYEKEDFDVKNKEDFKYKENDEDDIVALRYDHFRNRFIKMVNSVLKETERLKLTGDVDSVCSSSDLLQMKPTKAEAKTFRLMGGQKENDTSFLNTKLLMKREDEIAKRMKEIELKDAKKLEKIRKKLKKLNEDHINKKIKHENKVIERKREEEHKKDLRLKDVIDNIERKEKRANQIVQQQREEVREKLREQGEFLRKKRKKLNKFIKSMEQTEFENITQQISTIEDRHK